MLIVSLRSSSRLFLIVSGLFSLQILPNVYSRVWEEHLKERYSLGNAKAWDQVFTYITDRLSEGFANCPNPACVRTDKAVCNPLVAMGTGQVLHVTTQHRLVDKKDCPVEVSVPYSAPFVSD